jgi:hypothetical protein
VLQTRKLPAVAEVAMESPRHIFSRIANVRGNIKGILGFAKRQVVQF